MNRAVLRFVASINAVLVLYGLVFYVPAFAVSVKRIDIVLQSADIEQLGKLVVQLKEAQSAYGFFFLICCGLLLISAYLLWRDKGEATPS